MKRQKNSYERDSPTSINTPSWPNQLTASSSFNVGSGEEGGTNFVVLSLRPFRIKCQITELPQPLPCAIPVVRTY